MNILVLAYQLSPFRGSEYSVAWNYVQSMSEKHHLTVIYGVNEEHMGDFIPEEVLKKELTYPDHVTFVPVAPGWIANIINYPNRKNFFKLAYHPAYALWHKKVYRTVKKLLDQNSYDLIHYLGPIGYRQPGHLWKFDIPYIWGPISGLTFVDQFFFSTMSWRGRITYKIHNLLNKLQQKYSKRICNAVKRADVLLAATTECQKIIKDKWDVDAQWIPENGIADINSESLPKRDFFQKEIDLIWCGRVDARKQLIILLMSLVTLKKRNVNVKLHVVGDCVLASEMKQFANSNGISDMIVWHGKVARCEAMDIFSNSHIHVITSCREANTTVILEALANGVPTITFDHCGMHDTITDECGIKIPVPENGHLPVAVDGFSDAIEKLAKNRELLKKLSFGALKRAEYFLMSERQDFFEKQYRAAVEIFNTKKNN